MSDYQTPQKDGEVEKSLDEEEDLNDRENAEEFYTLMKEKRKNIDRLVSLPPRKLRRSY